MTSAEVLRESGSRVVDLALEVFVTRPDVLHRAWQVSFLELRVDAYLKRVPDIFLLLFAQELLLFGLDLVLLALVVLLTLICELLDEVLRSGFEAFNSLSKEHDLLDSQSQGLLSIWHLIGVSLGS